MTTTEQRLTGDEVARRGKELYQRHILPALRPEDEGKFVAIDVLTGEYEVDEDDSVAVSRLHGRLPVVEGWLECVGQPAAYRL